MTKLGSQEAHLLGALGNLGADRMRRPYPPIREHLDAGHVAGDRVDAASCRTMRDADGVTLPFHLPAPDALAIVRALRGERVQEERVFPVAD